MFDLTAAQEERALRLHKESIVVNAHNDISFDVVEQRSRGHRAVVAEKHLPKMKQAGLTLSVETVGGDSTLRYTFPRKASAQIHTHLFPLKRALHTVEAFLDEEAESGGQWVVARGAGDVEKARAEGKVAFLLALEGGRPLEDDISLLEIFYRLGVRVVGLTWNFRNELGDGATERTSGGLSHLGVEYVREMNRLGMIVDVSHLNEAGFWDVAKSCEGPFVASHSNARAITGGYGERNLSDDMIKAIGEHDGFIGLNALCKIITGRLDAKLSDLLDHLDRVVQLIGVDHVGIGLDILEDWPEAEYESIWGKWSVLTYPEGLGTITDLPNFTRGLVARGYGDDDIGKILGGNFLRVVRAVVGS